MRNTCSDEYGIYADFHIRGVRQRLRWIPPGEFLMGSPATEAERDSDQAQRRVILTQGYWLSDTACTQALWQAVMGSNLSGFKGEERPVENVSWEGVQRFIERLNQLAVGGGFRLPTEAEWEYACRAGTTTPFWFGEQITPEQVNYNGNYPYAGGKKGQYREQTVDVKALPCNGWGLYQMHGNVWEWCSDLYDVYDVGQRVLRGGSWLEKAKLARAACNYQARTTYWHGDIGFRMARSEVKDAR